MDFLNFPLHQRLLIQLLPDPPRSFNDVLPGFIDSLQTSVIDTDVRKIWLQTLEDIFRPSSAQYGCDEQRQFIFRSDGLILYVPDILGKGSYELVGKYQSNALFNTNDVKTCQSLHTIAHTILHVAHSCINARIEERKHIMQELHDSLGAKLLTMIQQSRGHPSASYAREALQTLRDIVHFSSSDEPQELKLQLGQWRLETQERVEITGAKLHWQTQNIEHDLKIDSTDLLLLLGFLRETISNALKHAQPENVSVQIIYTSKHIILKVSNDRQTEPPENWKWGFGLTHLQKRLLLKGGGLTLSHHPYIGSYQVSVVQATFPITQI